MKKIRLADILITMLLVIAVSLYVLHNRNNPLTSVINKEFDVTMTEIQEGLLKRGYSIEKVQPVDQGLKKAGYKMDHYRVIFYRDKHALQKIRHRHPEFTTLLPLTMTIIREKQRTRVISTPFGMLMKNAPSPAIKKIVRKWKKDNDEIIRDVRQIPSGPIL